MGYQNFSSLSPAAAPVTGAPPSAVGQTVAFIPSNGNLFVGSEQTGALYSYKHNRNLTSNYFASYGLFGGLDPEAERVLPRTKTATAGASVQYQLGHRDGSVGTVTGASTSSSSGYHSYLLSESVGWTHSWDSHLSSTVTAGLAEAWTVGPDGKETFTIGPLATPPSAARFT